jgi:hypothetical protein
VRALLLISLVACSGGAKHDDAPVSQPLQQPATPEPPRAMPKVMLGDDTVNVEIVATEAKIQKGLMFRQHLPPDDGMLFMMPGPHALEREGWPFWMHNTLIPLDLMWLDENLNIVEIFENAKVKDDTEVGGHVPSRYVLEVNAGYVAAHKVTKQTKVRFDNIKK